MGLEELLRAVRDGEDGAFKRLVKATEQTLYRYFIGRGIPAMNAQDLMQEVLLTTHRKLPLVQHGELRRWFVRVAYYKSVDYHRGVARGRETGLSHVYLLLDAARGIGTRIRDQQQQARLDALLAEMPTVLREVAQLDLESGDPVEFAARKGITLEAVRHRRYRYRMWLRERFASEFRNF